MLINAPSSATFGVDFSLEGEVKSLRSIPAQELITRGAS
jgi:hypothetical protein